MENNSGKFKNWLTLFTTFEIFIKPELKSGFLNEIRMALMQTKHIKSI